MSIIDAMQQFQRVDVSKFMNLPTWDGQADIKEINNEKWVVCPYCNKKLIKILPDTKIHKMPYVCKGSNCKKQFIVNVE